jgi:CubicO group peptidase (beta-lactamase class C family)
MISSHLLFAIIRNSGEAQGEHSDLVPWWSITKAVLAAAVLKLADLGVLRLDDSFEDWPFTIRQLLQHTSGLANYGGPAYRQAVASGEAVWSVDELLTRRNARRLLYPPGEQWAYSNIGYLFLRQLIERTTGADLDTALRQLIFLPLHILSTRIAMTASDIEQTRWGNPTSYDPRWVFHGLLIGPPTDAVSFLNGLLAGKVISAASLAAMQDERLLGGALPGRPWTQTGYGLGLMVGSMNDAGRVVGHSGIGHDSVSALYTFVDVPARPTVAVFVPGTDEGVAEHEAVRLALAG